MLRRLYENAPFHRKRIAEAGIDIEKLKSLDEFSKAMPVYDKILYRQRVEECEGDLIKLMDEELPVSVHDLIMVNSTTGTTEEPTPDPLTFNDIYKVWGESLCRGAWRAGVRKRDRIIHCYALSMVIGGLGIIMGMQKMGVTVLPVGAEARTDRILQI